MAKLTDVTPDCPICRAWGKVRDSRIMRGAQKVNLAVLRHMRGVIDRRIAKVDKATAPSGQEAPAAKETREHA